MYTLLIRLMLIAALLQFGISVSKFWDCHTGSCVRDIEKASREVLKIEWRPISLFPEEAKKFH